MKLLSLWEPWATLMALGKKRIETRSWDTSYRGWLAIQASKGGLSQADLQSQCFENSFYIALMDFAPFRAEVEAATRRKGWIKEVFPHGCIVAVVRLGTCWPTEQLDRALPGIADLERDFGNYEPGRWAWVTSELFRLPEPIPFKAKQGLVDLP